MRMQYTGYICGYFTLRRQITDPQTIDERWTAVRRSEAERSSEERMFTPWFYNFCYNNNGGDSNVGLRRFEMSIGECVDIETVVDNNTRKTTLFANKIKLYLAPFSSLLFSIRVDVDTEDLDDIIPVINKLRYTSLYATDPTITAFREKVLSHVMKVYSEYGVFASKGFDMADGANYRHLMENNNKFKVFQMVSVDSRSWKEEDTDQVLFELGALSRIRTQNQNNIFSPSVEYFQKSLDAGRISIFSNWKALALYDAFTMIGYEIPTQLREYQLNCVFEMIYIYHLFNKCYLTRLNHNLKIFIDNHNYALNRSNSNKLQARFEEFESKCWFDDVSYSVFVNDIQHSIRESMKIDAVKDGIYGKINHLNMKREKDSDTKMNNLLFFMTCLTMSSAIWDLCCLIKDMYPFGDETQFYTRFVTYITLFVALIVILYNKRKR